jgi:Tfp pilus assembly protein PilX
MPKLIRLHAENGSALVFALVFGIVMSIMGVVGLQLIVGGSSMSRRDIEVIKSFWANEGAMRVSFRYVSCVAALPTASIAPFTVTPTLVLNGDTPSVSITAIANSNGTYCYSCSTTTSMSDVNLINTTVCDSFSINSMSRYTWFEAQTSSAVWASMVVYGDYHTNGYINASSTMTDLIHVTGKATTSGRIAPNQTVDRANFPTAYQDGFSILNANGGEVTSEAASWFQARIPDYGTVGTIQTSSISPSSSSFTNATTVATTSSIDSVGIQLTGSNVTVWNRSSGTWVQGSTMSIANITGGILKTQKPTYVWGTLDGKLTVVSDSATGQSPPNDIIIGGNITYADTNLSTSSDVLALVSSNNVDIPSATNNTTTGMVRNFTTSGATVYASMFMSKGAINVENINSYSGMQNLNIHGGVLLNQSLGTYSTSPTNHGISANYYQDPRFVGNAALPPGIPYANAVDPERSTGGTTVYMYVLGSGTWVNTVGAL